MRFLFSMSLFLGCLALVGCETIAPASGSRFMQEAQVPDEGIRGAIHTALAQSDAFNDVNIQIMSEGGMVTLTGFVKTIKQYDTAVKIASETNGVRGVRNHLVIRK